MSLEAAIQENTAVMKQLIALFQSWGTPSVPSAPPVQHDYNDVPAHIAEVPTPKAEKPKAEKKVEPKQVTIEEAISYEDVKHVTLELAKKSRENATNLLAEFGVKVAPELKPEQYADYVAKGKEKLEALNQKQAA